MHAGSAVSRSSHLITRSDDGTECELAMSYTYIDVSIFRTTYAHGMSNMNSLLKPSTPVTFA